MPAKTVGLLVLAMLVGCQPGSRGIKKDYPRYNRTIRKIEDEHRLLNLVRLRYAETPVFLQIATIATTYESSAGAEAGAAGGASVASTGSVNVGTRYTETPTITYSLADSREFFGRVLAPVSADQLNVLAMGAGASRDLMRLVVRRVNGLENLQIYSGSAAPHAPGTFDHFSETLTLLARLEKLDLIEFSYGVTYYPISSHLETIDARAIPAGFDKQLQFTRAKDSAWVAERAKRALHLHFTEESESSSAAQRLRTLLGLAPGRRSFPLVDPEHSLTERSRLRGEPDADGYWTELVFRNRSMMEVLYFAAQGVRVPEEHVRSGIASQSLYPLDDLLRIRHSMEMPENASIRVQYGDVWFYIAHDDLRSKETFFLLNSLFSATAGRVPGGEPVLTIPVR